MLRVNNVDLSPRRLLQNQAAPQGPLPPPNNAEGSSEAQGVATVNLLQNTIQQVNRGQEPGVGGRVDLLG